MRVPPWHRQTPVPGGVYVFNGSKERFVRLAEMWIVECDGEPEAILPNWGAAVGSLGLDWRVSGTGKDRTACAEDDGRRWRVYSVDVEDTSSGEEVAS